ncbi:2Fe-2S iron-sulfur cluster binding domain-containing protein [Peziza echinospora]|nr:2Fe-2S iron-sulfur cluster binding domain-containing protein [Peziza echinospora]
MVMRLHSSAARVLAIGGSTWGACSAPTMRAVVSSGALAGRRAISTSPTSSPSSIQTQRLSSPIPSLRSTSSHQATRAFSTTARILHGHLEKVKPGEGVKVTFIDKDDPINPTRHTFEVAPGSNLLDIAQDNDIEMEGACGGSAACSTCHVIVEDQDMYDRLPEPDDDENDMLDLAFGLTETSRLGCQIKMTKDVDGLVVRLPSMTRNLQSSDFSKR